MFPPQDPIDFLMSPLTPIPYSSAKDDKAVGVSMLLLKRQHIREWKLWAHISIHDKESLWSSGQDLISEVIDASPCTKGSILLQVPKSQNFHIYFTGSHIKK